MGNIVSLKFGIVKIFAYICVAYLAVLQRYTTPYIYIYPMIIYFNQAYSSRPYVNFANESHLGEIYCGTEGLFSLMMLYAAVATTQVVSVHERAAIYYNNLCDKIREDDIFYKSFQVDKVSVSNSILAWRDLLVSVGWNLKYEGASEKLKFISRIEPEDFPAGKADKRAEVLRRSKSVVLFPPNSEVVVTQHKCMLEPSLLALFDAQEALGVKITYAPIEGPCASGNLGKIQQRLLLLNERAMSMTATSTADAKLQMEADDSSIEYLRFDNEDEALRYVASQNQHRWALYLCQQRKRFDNTLRLVGRASCGSVMENSVPQVLQLFTIGNAMFEYPLNVNRVLAWLNAPISPVPGKLRRELSKAVSSSGGVRNSDWNSAVEAYFASIEDESERSKQRKKFNIFMHFPQSETIDKSALLKFNKSLRDWAISRVQMEDFPFNPIVKEQLQQLVSYCNALMIVAESSLDQTVDSIQLSRWCKNIISPNAYQQYLAEAGTVDVVSDEGDIHSTAESMVWINICDMANNSYPFDFLNESEIDELRALGAYICSRDQHSLMSHYAMSRTLLNARRITLVESMSMSSGSLKRHPLILQLEELIDGGLKSIRRNAHIGEEHLEQMQVVDNNIAVDQTEIRLAEGVKLLQRWEKKQHSDKLDQASVGAESYSSLDLLIQHPFEYVCKYNAGITDINYPSAQDLRTTQGSVAHRMIEKVFEGSDDKVHGYRMTHEYDRIFNEAIDEVGLLLRSPEYKTDYDQIKYKMKKGLTRLGEIIKHNGLTVEGCEYNTGSIEWNEACRNEGEKVKLSAKIDMLLSDRDGNKVVFDFKWSHNVKRYVGYITRNEALQLSLYKYLVHRKFGCSVRTAYVVLPSMTLISSDEFESGSQVKPESVCDNAQRAAAAYRLRWTQFDEGRIECVESKSVGSGEYGQMHADSPETYYPLKVHENLYSDNIYSEYRKLR